MTLLRKLALVIFGTTVLNAQSVCLAATLKSMTPSLDKSSPASTDSGNQAQHLFRIHAGVSDEYILGPGDVLSVTDTTEDKPVSTTAPILPDGTVVISYTGVIQGAGKSLREMNELVNEQAKKWYVNPQIMINLAKQRPVQIYLLGEVVHPGLYSTASSGESGSGGGQEGGDEAEGEQGGSGGQSSGVGGQRALSGMVSSNTLTIAGALQLAGGLKDSADVRHLRVSRLAPKTTFQIDLWKLMIDGDVSEDIVLQPGDVVYVPKGGTDFPVNEIGLLVNNKPKVRVLGAVKQPGLLAMAPDDDIYSAIAKAGGFQDYAVSSHVTLARVNRDGTVTTEKVNMKKALKDGNSEARQKIRPGDIIVVKRSGVKTVGIVTGRQLPALVMSGVLYAFLEHIQTK